MRHFLFIFCLFLSFILKAQTPKTLSIDNAAKGELLYDADSLDFPNGFLPKNAQIGKLYILEILLDVYQLPNGEKISVFPKKKGSLIEARCVWNLVP